ncbi:MAG: DUF2752 domain-containing protein [Nanoarchaeota archaeon]|nr:DUF2752 domain-containing protein [Nanoarchaeota archaeon]
MKFKKIKTIFFDILSFGTPQAKVFNLSSILLILASVPTEYLKYSPVKCVFKHFLLPLIFNGTCPIDGIFANCNCPACGLTRGMSRLLHGDIGGALKFNRLVLIVFFVMLTLIIINIIKSVQFFKKTGKIYEIK